MSVTINPNVSGSKLLVTAGGPFSGGIDSSDGEDNLIDVQVFRGSTAIGSKTVGYTRGAGFYIAIVDTYNHGGNNVTYHVKSKLGDGYASENVTVLRGASLCVQEII